MDNYVILSGLMALLLVTSVFQAFELTGLKSQMAAKTSGVSFASAPVRSISGGGAETYEQMMARMHPGQFVQQQAASNALGGGQLANVPNQVGGC